MTIKDGPIHVATGTGIDKKAIARMLGMYCKVCRKIKTPDESNECECGKGETL